MKPNANTKPGIHDKVVEALNLIPKERRREYVTVSQMDKWFRIDGVSASGIVKRHDFKKEPVIFNNKNGIISRLYRPIDLIIYAATTGLRIEPDAETRIGILKAKEHSLIESIDALTNQINRLRCDDQNYRMVNFAASGIPEFLSMWASEREIIEHSHQIANNLCGVYFLIHQKKIVYVGQSVNVFARVNSHRDTKEFDEFSCVVVPPQFLDVMESIYIHMLEPPLNKRYTGGQICAPIRRDELIYKTTELMR